MIRSLLKLLVWCLALIAVLTLFARVVNPPSTLMLARWFTDKPVERYAVPLEAMGTALPRIVIAAEDSRFCRHGGVDWEALHEVITKAGEDGPARGASTIAMQTAKNLFLWPGRSYLRKALEIPLALWLDAVWPKRRLLEVYLNIAEWGEGIFGAETAAQHYFGKPAKALTRYEAALLAAALPNPLERNPAKPGPYLRQRAAQLAGYGGGLDGCLKE